MRSEAESIYMDDVLSEIRRAQAIRMLEACAISPNDVPLDTSFSREGDSVRLERYLRNAEGRKYVDPKNSDRAAIEEILIRPPADLIPEWIPS